MESAASASMGGVSRALEQAVLDHLVDEWDPLQLAGVIEAAELYRPWARELAELLACGESWTMLAERLLVWERSVGVPEDRGRRILVAKTLSQLRVS